MERQIKFRGQRVKTGKWVYGDLLHRFGLTEIYQASGTIPVIPETVGQFTGLKDKNGVEIYEGDIIKYYQPHSKKIETHIVQWDKVFACFGLFEKESGCCKESDWFKIEDIDIVGNIHANPELA